jgi:putative ABC transport system permease protein
MIGDLWIDNDREQALTVERNDGTVSERVRFRRDEASPDFFEAMGTPLLQGRFFSLADRPETPRVAIVNEALARRSWPNQDPVGRRFKLGAPESDAPWVTVVGVVADMRRQGLEREAVPQMFESLAQNPPRSVELSIRTSSDDPMAMAGALRAAVRSVERNAPIYAVAPLEQQLGNSLAQRRFETSLLSGFSTMALLLAAVGIYGLIQYSIATRTHEIGLRMAVGARGSDILRLVLGEGLRLCLAGLALGLVGAWWLGRLGSSLLFGVSAGDPWTFATASLLLTGVATAACYWPARRAAALDPVVALRTT